MCVVVAAAAGRARCSCRGPCLLPRVGGIMRQCSLCGCGGGVAAVCVCRGVCVAMNCLVASHALRV